MYREAEIYVGAIENLLPQYRIDALVQVSVCNVYMNVGMCMWCRWQCI